MLAIVAVLLGINLIVNDSAAQEPEIGLFPEPTVVAGAVVFVGGQNPQLAYRFWSDGQVDWWRGAFVLCSDIGSMYAASQIEAGRPLGS